MPTKEEIIEALGNMNPMELGALTRTLEEKWGVKAAPVAVQQTPSTDVQTSAKPEQTEYTVILKGFPADKKISIIKVVRECIGLGLKEAKDFTEALPKTLKDGLPKNEAEELAAKFKEAGAEVSVE